MMDQYLVIYTQKKKGFKACVVASLVCLGNASVIESSTIGTACIFNGWREYKLVQLCTLLFLDLWSSFVCD